MEDLQEIQDECDQQVMLKMAECGFLPGAIREELQVDDGVLLVREFSKFGMCEDADVRKAVSKAWNEIAKEKTKAQQQAKDEIEAEKEDCSSIEPWDLSRELIDRAIATVKTMACWLNATDEQKVALALKMSQLSSWNWKDSDSN